MNACYRRVGAAAICAISLVLGACGSTTGDGDGGSAGAAGAAGASGGASGNGGTGGVSGAGGTAGAGGVPGLSVTDKVDLLLVVDNSISMADKQELLLGSLPRLVQRLVAPRCLGADGAPTGSSAPCPSGSQPEFPPIRDLHVGVITSSLGGHGGNVCGDDPPMNDRGRLLPSVRPGLPGTDGFLSWKAGDDVGALVGDIAQHVAAAGEQGCGFEAPLESWYRFLVDPNPPANVNRDGVNTVASGTDDTVLSQRAAFLRPDSLVAILLLSDENDCSIRDSDAGWYVSTLFGPSGEFTLAEPTAVCETDPNSPCCKSCADSTPLPSGCPAANCQGQNLDPSVDKINLRCFEQKRRFGIDFMYPTARYVNALSRATLCPSRHDLDASDCPGPVVPNPLFTDLTGSGSPVRGSELVVTMGIVGVPWQLIATEPSLADPNALGYLSAAEIASANRWTWITGDYDAPPSDALMVESQAPRSGQSLLGPPASPDAAPGAHANGHEWNAHQTNMGDLQYACIYPLETPRDCDSGVPGGCDCKDVNGQVAGGSYIAKSPLCQDPATGQYSSTQHYAKAYPGLRQLAVLRDLGSRAQPASICAKTTNPASPAYGYNAAVDALVRVLGPRLVE